MVAIEVIHHMKSKTRGSEGCMALKQDISRAYDHINWDFSKQVMLKISFNDR